MKNKQTAKRDDWMISPMPRLNDAFELSRSFTKEEMDMLRRGNVPKEMEDKWFWYMEGNTLWAHRSWTGFCIYKIDFKEDGNHLVTVNRDPEQYACTSVQEDIKTLKRLLDWWAQPEYDYYNEWLEETSIAFEKAAKNKSATSFLKRSGK